MNGSRPDAELRVALVGLRAAGKSSVGPRLARRLRAAFVDADRELARRAAALWPEAPAPRRAGDWLVRLGEPAFRALELEVLRETLAGPGPWVLATGGGAVTSEEGRTLLAGRSFALWLDGPIELLRARMDASAELRPALGEGADAGRELARLAAERGPLYAQVARGRLALVEGQRALSPDELARQAALLLGR